MRILPRQSKGRAGCIGVQKKPSRELRLMAMLIPIPILTMPATARNNRTLGLNSGMERRTQVGQIDSYLNRINFSKHKHCVDKHHEVA